MPKQKQKTDSKKEKQKAKENKLFRRSEMSRQIEDALTNQRRKQKLQELGIGFRKD